VAAHVRRFEERDIERAIALTDLESWGYTRADFLRLLALHPDGCFVAQDGGHVVGLLTTTPYGRVAYLGAVIVQPDRRGERIGDTMMRAALDHLDARGIETVRLNAYLNVVPFYERLGFRAEYENIRWRGHPTDSVPHTCRTIAREDLPRIVPFDRIFFGADREELLRALAKEFPRTFLVAERQGAVAGYVVGNTSPGSCEIGPWIVNPNREGAGPDLFHGLLRNANARTVSFTAPAPNRRAHGLARRLGFEEAFRTLRMVRGRDAHHGRPEGVWALAGLEKG
jgi:predicted N-acetyltransferase YhbS